MLELELRRTDIVVLSDSNNPRLLNPDFLERNVIVPIDWKAVDVVVSPPFAVVRYANGVTIQVEENKLQFSCTKPKEFNWASEIPRIAARYLEILPHVAYRSVGLNYQLISKLPTGPEAEDQLMAKLMKSGPWQEYASGATSVLIELQYRKVEPRISLRVGVNEIATPQGIELDGYSFHANVHHDFSHEDVAPRREYMQKLGGTYSNVCELVGLLGLEPEWQKPH